MNFFTKNKVIAGVIGVLAVVSVVNTQAILKLTNSVWGNTTNQSISLDGQNQSAQTINFSAKITEGEVYKRGDKSETILKVQEILASKGLYSGAISGLIGPKTESAIMDFQNKNALKATGVLDSITLKSILRDVRPVGGSGGTDTLLCNSNTEPWIKVLSPNGGESYQAGQNIRVTWDSCNVSNTTDMQISLFMNSSISLGLSNQTPNDGAESFTLPTNNSWVSMEYGNMFRIRVNMSDNVNIFDYSDSMFAINGEVGCAEGTIIGYNPDGTPIYCGGIYNGCAEGTIIGYTQDGTPIYCGGAPVPIDCAEGTIIGYDANGPIYCQGGGGGDCSPGTVIGYDENGPIYCQ